jgi:CubicO group peptidase (beta-lactamase class C family)
VLVLQRGQPVLEYQRSGLTSDTLHEAASVTKSVLSMLVGMAVAQGRIPSLDTPVVTLMPELADANTDARVQQLSVHHLLTMTAGFQGSERRFIDAKARDRFAMSRRFEADPGTRFRYDNPAADLLAALLARSVGETPAAYAQRQLFTPLGIAHFEWAVDEQGQHHGFSGLRLRTRDMARLGQLMLQQGQWDGRRLLPPDYVRAPTTAQSAGGPPLGLPYGYHWWVSPADAVHQQVVASGFGGQFIWVDPALELVVAATSDVSPGSAARGQALALFRQGIVPAALSSQADLRPLPGPR